MKIPEIKIHAYKVNQKGGPQSFAEQMAEIFSFPLEERTRTAEGSEVRLEHYEKKGALHLCDFLKIRTDHGPGKASKAKAIVGFDLEEDEGFGEETALLYDAKSHIALLQYNHHGPRVAAIEQYCSLFFHSEIAEYEFLPRYEDDIQRRLEKKTIFRSFEVSIAPRLMNDNDFNENVSLSDAVKFSNAYDADIVTISIGVDGRDRKSSLSGTVRNLSQWVLERVGKTPKKECPIKSSEVSGKDNAKTPVEVLDLVAQRIVDKQQVIKGIDKRFTRDSRWVALDHSWRKLRKQLLTDEH